VKPQAAIIAAIILIGGCGDSFSSVVDATAEDGPCAVVDVVRFDPGEGSGHGSDRLPGVVIGVPDGGKTSEGSLDVLSLGLGGELIVRLGCDVRDGDGVDLVVYENAFLVGSTGNAFAEPAEIAVSADGEIFHAFFCEAPTAQVAPDDGVDGCAGLAPVAANAENGLAGVFPDGGGDGFDLARVGLERARFVRIRDRSAAGATPNAGFDLDAVVAVVRE
jgi:hypothetical protein